MLYRVEILIDDSKIPPEDAADLRAHRLGVERDGYRGRAVSGLINTASTGDAIREIKLTIIKE